MKPLQKQSKKKKAFPSGLRPITFKYWQTKVEPYVAKLATIENPDGGFYFILGKYIGQSLRGYYIITREDTYACSDKKFIELQIRQHRLESGLPLLDEVNGCPPIPSAVFDRWFSNETIKNEFFMPYKHKGVEISEYIGKNNDLRHIQVGDLVFCNLKPGIERNNKMIQIQNTLSGRGTQVALDIVKIDPPVDNKIESEYVICSTCAFAKSCPGYSKTNSDSKLAYCNLDNAATFANVQIEELKEFFGENKEYTWNDIAKVAYDVRASDRFHTYLKLRLYRMLNAAKEDKKPVKSMIFFADNDGLSIYTREQMINEQEPLFR